MKTTTTIDTRKTIDFYDIEGFYCGKWSVECSENTYAEARKTLKEYRDNCPQTAFRIKERSSRSTQRARVSAIRNSILMTDSAVQISTVPALKV